MGWKAAGLAFWSVLAVTPERPMCFMTRTCDSAMHMDVFLHIPKASGTTIRTIISREYGAASTAYYEPETENFEHRVAPEAYLRARIAEGNVRLITGHLRYGIHEFLRQPCRYFSMVRDPGERALSDYFYAFAYPSHRYRDQIVSGGMKFIDFLAAEAVPAAAAICHFLGGQFAGLNGGAEAALFHLRRGIVTVGTSERFDESMLLIARDLGWRPPLYLPRNVTRLNDVMRDRRRRTAAEARDLLRAQFASDYEVYAAADELLSQRIFYLGNRFRLAFDNYRELQEALSRYGNPKAYDEYNLEQDDLLPRGAEVLRDSAPYRSLAEYLLLDPVRPDDRHNFVGYFDGRSPRIMGGWAMDLSRPTPITVTLRYHDRVVATKLCDIPRTDVVASGFPGIPCGFRFELDPPAEDLSGFTVCFENSLIQLHG
jgi:hypothetical protein